MKSVLESEVIQEIDRGDRMVDLSEDETCPGQVREGARRSRPSIWRSRRGGPGLGAIVMCCSERGFVERLRLGDGSGRGHVGVPGRPGGRLVKSLVPL